MLRWRDKEGSLGNLLAVYPAREPGIALVSVTELDKPLGEIDPALLVETFDVTRAEAEIAVALYSGLDLSEVALLRGVASATVRGQVKALLHKAGVASQRHLMLVLSRVAAASPPTWGATTRSSVEPGYASRPEGFDPALTASSKKVTLSVRRRAAL